MNSIFDAQETAYDKTEANKIIIYIKKSNLEQRKQDIEDLKCKISKLKTVAKKVNENRRIEYKIRLKQNQSELRRLNSQFYYRKNKCDKHKIKLFKMMRNIIIKNILNYIKITENSPVTDRCNNKVEMEAEAYIVMYKCVCNFNVNAKSDFYYYFNKSLARNFYRMFDREFRKKEKYDGYSSERKHFRKTEHDKGINYDVDFLISQMDVDELQIRLMKSKLAGQKKDDFLKENKDVTSSKYYSTLKSIKQIMLKMKENGEF